MTDFKIRPPYMDLCLCRRCAEVYFNDPAYWVERSNPIQTVRELCDVCSHNTVALTIRFGRSHRMCDCQNRIVEEVSENEYD